MAIAYSASLHYGNNGNNGKLMEKWKFVFPLMAIMAILLPLWCKQSKNEILAVLKTNFYIEKRSKILLNVSNKQKTLPKIHEITKIDKNYTF